MTAILDRYGALGAAALYFAAVLLFYPFRDVFQFNPDEGINAIKALLIDRGYVLYDQIWSDQPPLFTYMLRGWFSLFGWEVNAGRSLVLFFASLIVFATYDIVRLSWNHGAAIAAVLLLPCSAYFLVLSVSVMLGLPSLALALLCLWALVRWARSGNIGWLLTAGFLMGLSLLMKLFTAFLLPLFALWIFFIGSSRRHSASGRPVSLLAALWLLVSVITSLGLFVALVGAPDLGQLYAPHASARELTLGKAHNLTLLLANLLADWQLALLATLGTLLIFLRRRWELLIFPAWAAVALAILLLHAPIWYHHHLLLNLTAPPVAGIVIAEAFKPGWESLWQQRSFAPLALRLVTIALTLSLAIALATGQKANPRPPVMPNWHDHAFSAVAVMKRYSDATTTVIADLPMYAFRAGYEVPPNLAVISQKRFATDNLSADEILATIDRRAPEQIIMTQRFQAPVFHWIVTVISDRYRLVYSETEQSPVWVYVRRDIANGHAARPVFPAGRR